jgi:pyruvate/2-oxoglutarate dehydrogenase complex dihydrolipoamide acyltransferase (E2) component
MNDYTLLKNYFIRILNNDLISFGLKKHHYKILTEIEITKLLEIINKKKEMGVDISLTAIIIKILSETITKNKKAHGFWISNTKIKVFNDIDVEVQIEKNIDNQNIPFALIIKEANKKNIYEITNEIRSYKIYDNKFIEIFCYLPKLFRIITWKIIFSNPQFIKKYFGTVSVTSIGMIKNFDGWIIPTSVQQLCVGIGNIIENNEKKIIKLTFLFDHDIIDGGDAARFVSDFSCITKDFSFSNPLTTSI